MSGQRLLVVDDEPQIVRSIRPGLVAAGYEVESAHAGHEALQMIARAPYDVIIVDLGLPDMDGKELIARVREWSETPILVLSARDTEQDKVEALDIGANDFVNKPFGIQELMARLRATLRGRRADRPPAQNRVQLGAMDIDFEARRVRVDGREARPSPREAKLLRVFVEHVGQVLTHKQIVAAVWGGDQHVDAQFVRVLVGNLRQKIEKDPARPTRILTEPGIGYRLRIDA
jgi:two-component system KDP operon response regulator KdpE